MAFQTEAGKNYKPLQLGTYHMVGNDNWEPQRTNNFIIQFEGLGNLVSVHTGKNMPSNAAECIALSCKTVGDINQQIEALKVSWGNNAINFAGKPQLSDIQVVVNDFIGLQTERIISAWHGLVYNPYSQKIGRASVYKKTAYLFEFAPDGTQTKVWQLLGCWPGNIQYGGYDSENANIRQITFNLNVDYAIPLD
ncbi:MAG: hypothetical protein IJA19_06315 [Clostridia bacterium]|nr:hypothetical protein [Clostridia bacterium]